eukprot:g3987.t1
MSKKRVGLGGLFFLCFAFLFAQELEFARFIILTPPSADSIEFDLSMCSSVPAINILEEYHFPTLPPSVVSRYLSRDELAYDPNPSSCIPRFPIVLEATSTFSFLRFRDWLRANNGEAAKALVNLVKGKGAILLRGFSDFDDGDFELMLKSDLGLPPAKYTGSIGRRERVTQEREQARTFVTRYPANMILMPHLEFGNLPSRPEFIAFYVDRTSGKYGETPVIDFAGVWKNMSASLQAQFRKGVKFTTRMYPTFPYRMIWGDLASNWEISLDTKNSTLALDRCNAMEGVKNCYWSTDGALEYVMEFPGVHFNNDEAILSTTFGFWNSYLPLLSSRKFFDRFDIYERIKGYLLMRFKFYGTAFDPTPTRATWLDGSSMTQNESEELVDLIWKHAVIFTPKPGDISILNNKHIGHGRMNIAGNTLERRVISFIGGQYVMPKL